MHCIICDSNNLKIILNVEDYPFFTVPVTKKDKSAILNTHDNLFDELCYWACKDCGHVQINNLPNENIIDELYTKYYTYPSPLEDNFEPVRDNYFINYFKNTIYPFSKTQNLNTVLEIGCYDGYILKCLSNIGYLTLGCDPSNGADIGNLYGLDIRKEKFSSENFVSADESFDIIISRHFIEHVFDPYEYIKEFGKVLKHNGVLIIETPNIKHFLKKGLLEVFSLQHISLFSETSLKYALEKSGFQILFTDESTDSLIITAKKSINVKATVGNNYNNIIDNFNKQVCTNKLILSNILNDPTNLFNSIGIWGAGGFGIATIKLYNIETKYIKYFIDSDPNKWDMEYLNYTIPIVPPSFAKDNPPSIIIIASMYSKNIVDNMDNSLKKVQKILLNPHVELIK